MWDSCACSYDSDLNQHKNQIVKLALGRIGTEMKSWKNNIGLSSSRKQVGPILKN
jgi:hypothetical protein